MFRLIIDINELNIDKVTLPKIPGIGMIMRLPNDQKFSMLVNVLNSQKTQLLPKLEEEAAKKWGYIRISDLAAEMPTDGSCYIRFRIDVADADYDKAIDSIIPSIFQPDDVLPILGEGYTGTSSTPDVITFMHQAPSAAQKEFYLVKTLSTEKQTISQRIEYAATTQGAVVRMGALRFLLKQN